MAYRGRARHYRRPLAERLWEKVDRSGGAAACWPWTGCTTGGYGRIGVGSRSDGTKKSDRASRVALELHLGRPLIPGMDALHNCDNPPCCNPKHLFEGTQADNNADKDAKGRAVHVGRPGERHHFARLNEKQVAEIRTLAKGGLSQRALGRNFGVSQTQISKIVRGVRWKGLG